MCFHIYEVITDVLFCSVLFRFVGLFRFFFALNRYPRCNQCRFIFFFSLNHDQYLFTPFLYFCLFKIAPSQIPLSVFKSLIQICKICQYQIIPICIRRILGTLTRIVVKKIIIISGFFIQEVVRKMQLNANKNVQQKMFFTIVWTIYCLIRFQQLSKIFVSIELYNKW